MKRRIEQLINGRFEYNIPKLLSSEEKIESSVKYGEKYTGSFKLKSQDGSKVKGNIYPSVSRAICSTYDFSDREIQIFFEIDTAGVQKGHSVDGEFCISSSLGEYSVSFRIRVEKEALITSKGGLKDLPDFVKLASGNFTEAYRAFVSPQFRGLLRGRDEEYLSLYDGLSKMPVNYQHVEEFLVGAKLKEPVQLSLVEKRKVIEDFKGSCKETVALSKQHWGFLQVDVSVDVPFIEIEKKKITNDDFIGSKYIFEYVVREERLHGGRNFGRITFSTYNSQLTYDVVIERERMNLKWVKNRELRKYVYQLASLYMEFRKKLISLEEWVTGWESALVQIERLGDEYRYFRLFKAHLLLAQEQYDKAGDILKQFEEKPRLLRNFEMRAYYSYLTAMHNKSELYLGEVNRFIGDMVLQHQESWPVLWTKLYLDEDLKRSPARRLEAIKEQFKLGVRSRVMYLEAYSAMQEEPLRIKQLTDFENRVILWATREELLDEAIAKQCARASHRYKKFDRTTFKVLTACYECFPSEDVLAAVCGMLIKGNCTQNKYFTWYEKAVAAELRITRLYEYYVDSMDENFSGVLPNMIRKYFAYNNTLGYKKKAFIYANVIKHKEEDNSTFLSYRDSMISFASQQLALGHINRDLGIIYEAFLDKIELTHKVEEALAEVLFTYEIRCVNPRVKRIDVIHHTMEGVQTAPCQERTAYVHMYSADVQLIFYDELGRRHADMGNYTVKRLISDQAMVDKYVRRAAYHAGVLLHLCDIKGRMCYVDSRNVYFYQELLLHEEIKESCRKNIRKGLLIYYHKNPEADKVDGFLEKIGYENWIETDKAKFIEILIMRFCYKEALELICQYGYEEIDIPKLVQLCSRMIIQYEKEEQENLLDLACYVFQHGKYDEIVLGYLTVYYRGPVRTMYQIWQAAIMFEIDTFELEERILVFLLFTRGTLESAQQIFESYCRQEGKKKVIYAYLVYESYEYFVKGRPLAEGISDHLKKYYFRGTALDKVCYLCLIKYYAFKTSLNSEEEAAVHRLLEEFVYEGLEFEFYKKFPAEWVRAYNISDKVYVEYTADPKHKVYIEYEILDENQKVIYNFREPMKNVYEGIFVKKFMLFYGQTLSYSIEEKTELSETVKEVPKNTISYFENVSGTRKFKKLNGVLEKRCLHEEKNFEKNLEEYLKEIHLTEKMFTLM